MKKKLYATISVLLIFVLFSSLATKIPMVKAYDVYGSSVNMYTTNWLQWDLESEDVANTFSEISMLFMEEQIWDFHLLSYYVSSLGPTYGEVNNWDTQIYNELPPEVYAQTFTDMSQYSDCCTILCVGHSSTDGFYGFTQAPDDPDQTPQLIDYSFLQSITQFTSIYHFVFMWDCFSADTSNAANAWNFIAENDISDNPDFTFIGWQNASPWLEVTMHPGINNDYQSWLEAFYYQLLDGYTVMSALNSASEMTSSNTYSYAGDTALHQVPIVWPYNCYIDGVYVQAGTYYGNMAYSGTPTQTWIPTSYTIETWD